MNCISKSNEDKVFHVCTDNNILISTKPRRLSIHCNMGHYVSSSNNDHSCARSLFIVGSGNFFSPSELKLLLKGFKLVRVLDIGTDRLVRKIPFNLGNFIHLRYLRMDTWGVKFIPASILTLENLQIIDLGHFRVFHFPISFSDPISFPAGIWKLDHLRHLYGQAPIMLRGHCSGSNEVMLNLQTIFPIALDRQTTSLIKKVRFPNLKN